MSLLQFDDDVMPFTFADVLILRYLIGTVDEFQTVQDFNTINLVSDINWTFRSQVTKFIKRFWSDPYRNEDQTWIQTLVGQHHIKVKSRLTALSRLI